MFASSGTMLPPFGSAANTNMLFGYDAAESSATSAEPAQAAYFATTCMESSKANEKAGKPANAQLSLLLNRTLLRSASATAHNAANALFSESNTPQLASSHCACFFCGSSPALLTAKGDSSVRACGACVQRLDQGASCDANAADYVSYLGEQDAPRFLERCMAALDQRAARHSSGALSVDSGTGGESTNGTATSRSRTAAAGCSACRRRPSDEALASNAVVRCSVCDESLCASCAYQHQLLGCTSTPSGQDSHEPVDVFDAAYVAKRSPTARHDAELDAELRALSVSSGAVSGAASSGVNSNARSTPCKSLSLCGSKNDNSARQQSAGVHEREPSGAGSSAPQSPSVPDLQSSLSMCQRHVGEPVRMYCRTCEALVCQLCIFDEQSSADLIDSSGHRQHDLQLVNTAVELESAVMRGSNQEAKSKLAELRQMVLALQQTSTRLVVQLQKSQSQVDDAAALATRLVAERRDELHRTLQTAYQSRAASIGSVMQQAQEQLDRLQQHTNLIDKLLVAASNPLNPNRGVELLVLNKVLSGNLSPVLRDALPDLARQFTSLVSSCTPLPSAHSQATAGVHFPELDYLVDEKLIQAGVTHLLGSLRTNSSNPNNQISNGSFGPIGRSSLSDADLVDGSSNDHQYASKFDRAHLSVQAAKNALAANAQKAVAPPLTARTSVSVQPAISASAKNLTIAPPSRQPNELGKWNANLGTMGSTQRANGNFVNSAAGHLQTLATLHAAGVDLSSLSAEQCELVAQLQAEASGSKLPMPLPRLVFNSVASNAGNTHATNGMAMLRSAIKRTKMTFNVKFGEFGVLSGQFTEPSGVAVSLSNEIVVADTNNHRIQVFDSDGRFKFQFGECGKHDSQLLYPNRVAVNPLNGDIVVTERSPTHQIQIYSQTGKFLRKFGANVLQYPRGVTVDNQGRILVVECKVMRILIFDQYGNLQNKFGCSKYLEFPNAIAVNDKEEIFISDNRAHCVKVFDYQGRFLRSVGGEGITNYPIGVAVSPSGEILVADNHNNFNLTVFSADGELIAALESKVKHAQCFDIALLRDASDSVVLASKDYRLYIYPYKNPPPVTD